MSDTAIEKKKTLFESLPEIGTEVYDQSTNEKVKITESDQLLAVELVNRVARNTIDTARAIHEIKERRAYIQLGCTSFKGFVEEWLPFGRNHAYSLCALGERIEPILLSLKAGEDATPLLGAISMNKYQELLDLDDEQFKKFVKGEEFLCGDGRVMTADEIAKSSVKEIKDALKSETKARKELEAKLATATEELKTWEEAGGEDAKARGEMVIRIQKLNEKIMILQGGKKKEQDFRDAIAEVCALCDQALATLLPYIPKDEADYQLGVTEGFEAMGVAAKYEGKFEHLVAVFNRAKMAYEGGL